MNFSFEKEMENEFSRISKWLLESRQYKVEQNSVNVLLKNVCSCKADYVESTKLLQCLLDTKIKYEMLQCKTILYLIILYIYIYIYLFKF